jgi:hypothetical protein
VRESATRIANEERTMNRKTKIALGVCAALVSANALAAITF